MRSRGNYITVDKYVEVEFEMSEIIERLDDTGIATLAKKAGLGTSTLAAGDGDQARIRNIIDSAYFAALRLPDCPREIKDLFWYVHERAM